MTSSLSTVAITPFVIWAHFAFPACWAITKGIWLYYMTLWLSLSLCLGSMSFSQQYSPVFLSCSGLSAISSGPFLGKPPVSTSAQLVFSLLNFLYIGYQIHLFSFYLVLSYFGGWTCTSTMLRKLLSHAPLVFVLLVYSHLWPVPCARAETSVSWELVHDSYISRFLPCIQMFLKQKNKTSHFF